MQPLTFDLHAAGVVAPGLTGLAELQRACLANQVIEPQPLSLAAPDRLPMAERRRASGAARLVLACTAQVMETSPFDPASLRSVFASDEGTGEVCQQMLGALTTTRQVSPLLFTNSVHNAPAGYFSIGWQNRQPFNVVSLGADSFACGLLTAVTDAVTTGTPVLLVVSDPVLPAPLDELLPVVANTAAAFLLTSGSARDVAPALGRFGLSLHPGSFARPSPLPDWMPAAWHANSSARAIAALALLESPPGAVMNCTFGHQILALRRLEDQE
ncbi:beta-ketoacyl synthase chain length factor [Ottowia sp.]|jgi:hypothetical protein|uniref:beta-ketoacyl synthase chain length factor n=1 Tax=Ottowia sp. TaxID=1898956 RepID=UPI002CF0C29D|nr:beta-ketoacyl synthase chain length factor [Ottowia sp.]HRN77122.1 beta-ketoacyl synthase chain length factor [Ottowia sp.]